MAPRPHVPDELRDRPFRGTEAVKRGLLTKRQLHGSAWPRLFRDIYVWRGLPLTGIVRAQAVELLTPPTGVVTGRCAAWLMGVDILRREDSRLEVTIGREQHLRPDPALRIRRALIPDEDLETIEGVLFTNLPRTAFDLCRRRRPRSRYELTEAVVALDALVHWSRVDADALDALAQRQGPYLRTLDGPARSLLLAAPGALIRPGALDLDEFQAYALSHRGWRGVRLVPEVVGLCEPAAESPMESRLRMLLALNGFPKPEVQFPVRVDGATYRIDLAYPDEMLAIEYDGASHRDRWPEDLRRQNQLEDLGWQFRRYTSDTYYNTPNQILTQIGRALRRS